MEVRDGWATEYGRQRYDVTVQEQDVIQIFAENGIPAEYADKMTLGEKWSVMTRYAHWYAMTESIRLAPPERHMEASTKASVEGQNLARVLEAFKARVGLSADAPHPYEGQADDRAGSAQPVAG
jgi:predicted solute-binding protein